MSKTVKYLLGFVGIFIAAIICVFGIIKYEEAREQNGTTSTVDNKKFDAETTKAIDKLSSVSDVDSLKSELNLSQDIVDRIKEYAPIISFSTLDNDGTTVVYLRQGGDLDNNDIKNDEILGYYEIKDGKLSAISENIDILKTKFKNIDMKWITLDIKNTEHSKRLAREIINKYFFVTHGKNDLGQAALFGYLIDPSRQIRGNGMITGYVVVGLDELTDIYNTAYKEKYNAEDVQKDIPLALKDSIYREIDDSYTGNEKKYQAEVKLGETIYFKKDKMYLTGMGGIGGATTLTPSPESDWTIEGDRIIVPILGPDKENKGNYVLRLNNKNYQGGANRSKYYIESVDVKF